MKILLTGNKGYIGSWLEKRLEEKHEVIGVDIKADYDLLTETLFAEDKFDAVIHLAGKSGVRESLEDPASYWYNNIEVTRKIFSRFKNTRVIYASSSSAYEPELNPYANSKWVMEQLALDHSNALGMRFHTVYSEEPRKGMFLDKLINGTLTYTTNHLRDYIHIEDVCDTIIRCLNNGEKGVMDVGTGHSIRVRFLAPHLPVRLNTPYERQHTQANTKRMTDLGILPKYNIIKFLTNKGFEYKIKA